MIRIVRVVRLVITKIDVTRPICDSLLGKKHSHMHRMLTGIGVMALA